MEENQLVQSNYSEVDFVWVSFLSTAKLGRTRKKGKQTAFSKKKARLKKKIFGKEIEKKKYVFNLQKG